MSGPSLTPNVETNLRIVSRVGLSPDYARTFLQRLTSASQPQQATAPYQQLSAQTNK